jgi:hypothetical protein
MALVLCFGTTTILFGQDSFNIKNIPDTWIQLTKIDTGYIIQEDFDNGSYFIVTSKTDTIEIIGDDKLLIFQIFQQRQINKLVLFDGALKMTEVFTREPVLAKVTFEWVDFNDQISKWILYVKNDTIMNYYSPIGFSSKYPVVIINDKEN